MKIITRGVIDWATLEILEEECFEYTGLISLCKDSGSAPQPVDPYTQAAAEYGLDTGTAAYNAGLNRTNTANPLGSSTWSTSATVPGYSYSTAPGTTGATPTGSAPSAPGYSPNPLSGAGLEGLGGSGVPITSPGALYGLGGASTTNPTAGVSPPTYTQTTQLQPWAQNELEQPLDTSGLPGMPGGPSITQNLQDTQDAIFNQQMGYAAPEEALASEGLNSQLANEGATVGSAAYNNEQARLGRQQTFTNQQAADQAITGGEQEQSNLFGLGTQALNNQIATRAAPINEYNSLNGSPGATSTAATPDISSAFGQQYQGALAGYNANVSSDNATTSGLSSLALAAAMYF